ncbi:hypothetical protein Pelo_3926 [Pelomyxa schiedti]|nr:hypothetical protein Pelo_3926 [Pelomyxa schiedti]
MMSKKQEILDLLNTALEDERAAVIEYTTCLAVLRGPTDAPLACTFECFANEEACHVGCLTKMISVGFESVPSTRTRTPAAPPSPGNVGQILDKFLNWEQHSIEGYRAIRNKVWEATEELPTTWECVDDKIRHIMIDQEKHYAVLKKLKAGM